jgi:hypothetical protein
MDENSDRALGPHWFHLVFYYYEYTKADSIITKHNYPNMNELSVINVQNIFSKFKKFLFWDPCFFLYKNDLPKIINNNSIHILFANDNSILFTNSNLTNYNKGIYKIFKLINKWFKGNFLSLNFEKTHYIHFITKSNPTVNMKICCNNNLVPSVLHTKFLGINIDSTLYWRTHIEQLISKLLLFP